MTDTWRKWTHDLLDKLKTYKQLNQRLATDNGLLLARNNELKAKLEKQQRPGMTSSCRVPSLPTLYDEPEPLEQPKSPLPTEQLISDKLNPLDDKPTPLEHPPKQLISNKPKPLEHIPKQPISDKSTPLEHPPKQSICDELTPLAHPPKQPRCDALPQTKPPPSPQDNIPPKRSRPPLANYVLPSLKRKLRRGDRFACNSLQYDTIPTKKPRV